MPIKPARLDIAAPIARAAPACHIVRIPITAATMTITKNRTLYSYDMNAAAPVRMADAISRICPSPSGSFFTPKKLNAAKHNARIDANKTRIISSCISTPPFSFHILLFILRSGNHFFHSNIRKYTMPLKS